MTEPKRKRKKRRESDDAHDCWHFCRLCPPGFRTWRHYIERAEGVLDEWQELCPKHKKENL